MREHRYSQEFNIEEKTNKHNWTIIILRTSIGLLFVLSGILKTFDLVLFEETIILFNIFPEYSKLLTILIPSLEIVAGAFLLTGIFKKAAIIMLISLVSSFIIAIWVNLRQGFVFDCGCFGPLEIFSKISTGKIIFNIVLIFSLTLIFFKVRENINLINHLGITATYTLIVAVLIYIPFSNVSWAYTINAKNIEELNWEKANFLIRNNDAVLFDARATNRYEKEHVPGALSLPVLDFGRHFQKYDKLSKETLMIVYCDGKDCSAATKTSLKLIARGYKNVFKVRGGFDAWSEAN